MSSSKSTPIVPKYYAGQVVFWLGSTGFKTGIVKRVSLDDSVNYTGLAYTRSTNLKYYLCTEEDHKEYQGACISEHLIFTTYAEMLKYYDENATCK